MQLLAKPLVWFQHAVLFSISQCISYWALASWSRCSRQHEIWLFIVQQRNTLFTHVTRRMCKSIDYAVFRTPESTVTCSLLSVLHLDWPLVGSSRIFKMRAVSPVLFGNAPSRVRLSGLVGARTAKRHAEPADRSQRCTEVQSTHKIHSRTNEREVSKSDL